MPCQEVVTSCNVRCLLISLALMLSSLMGAYMRSPVACWNQSGNLFKSKGGGNGNNASISSFGNFERGQNEYNASFGKFERGQNENNSSIASFGKFEHGQNEKNSSIESFSKFERGQNENNASFGTFGKLRHMVETSGPPTFGHSVYASDTYRIIYARVAGKLGGTTLRKSYLERSLCRLFCNLKSYHIGDPKHRACMEYLSTHRIWYTVSGKPWSDYSTYFTFAYVRNPCQRAISSYRYVTHKDPKRVSDRYPFDKFLHDIHKVANFQKTPSDTSAHWIPQVTGLLASGLRRIDFISCVKDMDSTLVKLVEEINSLRPNDASALPAPKQRHANSQKQSVSIDSLTCGTESCRDKICKESLYRIDCNIIPCGCS